VLVNTRTHVWVIVLRSGGVLTNQETGEWFEWLSLRLAEEALWSLPDWLAEGARVERREVKR